MSGTEAGGFLHMGKSCSQLPEVPVLALVISSDQPGYIQIFTAVLSRPRRFAHGAQKGSLALSPSSPKRLMPTEPRIAPSTAPEAGGFVRAGGQHVFLRKFGALTAHKAHVGQYARVGALAALQKGSQRVGVFIKLIGNRPRCRRCTQNACAVTPQPPDGAADGFLFFWPDNRGQPPAHARGTQCATRHCGPKARNTTGCGWCGFLCRGGTLERIHVGPDDLMGLGKRGSLSTTLLGREAWLQGVPASS